MLVEVGKHPQCQQVRSPEERRKHRNLGITALPALMPAEHSFGLSCWCGASYFSFLE